MESIFSVKTGVVFSDNDAAYLLPEFVLANQLGVWHICELVSLCE